MRTKADLYGSALRRQAQLQKAIGATTVGLFLGLLDHDDRARLDQQHYDDATELVDGVPRRYSDEAMVRRGLFDWESAVVDAFFPPGAAVAIVGAGSGREVLALLEGGFEAQGYEPHPGLVRTGDALLTADGHPGRLQLVPRDAFPGAERSFDAVVVGWGAYGLIGGRERRIELLRGARAALPEGAPVLVSFMTFPPESRFLDTAYRIARLVRVVRRAEPPERGDCLLPNFVHYFTPAEVRSELGAAGFRTEAIETEPYGHAVGKAV